MKNYKPYKVILPEIEDKETIKEGIRKEVIICGILIIFLGLFLGYWTALHISADELDDGGGDTNTEDTIEEIKDTIEDIQDAIDELNEKLNDEVERLDEENQIINNYMIIQSDLNDIQTRVDEYAQSQEEIIEDEPLLDNEPLLDIEERFQYYPFVLLILFCNLYVVFKRSY